MRLFDDRADAGRKLAQKLSKYGSTKDGPAALVLGLPRGGVPVAFEVARALGAPLDVFIVRKLGVPGHEELAMGAIASGGAQVMNDEVLAMAQVPPRAVDTVLQRERRELARRETLYRGRRPRPQVAGRTVIVVDDGLATGATMLVAVRALRALGPARLVVAAPVGSYEACRMLEDEADEVVCFARPTPFYGVGAWYADFSQTDDAEVHELLAQAMEGEMLATTAAPAPDAETDATVREVVEVETDEVALQGDLTIPAGAEGLVLFAHGSGSSRHSVRNKFVASELNERGLGTLLIDLLTREEEYLDAKTGHLRFDIGLLARRLVGAIDWLTLDERTQRLAIGCFGASTGAAAALAAAAARPESVRAVVSRGGRPDLAGNLLDRVRAPTLLIVGGADRQVIDLNKSAARRLRSIQALEIIPGASHLFPEPGALEQVATLAGQWFERYLVRGLTWEEAADGPSQHV